MTRNNTFNRLGTFGPEAQPPVFDAAVSSDDGLASFACPETDDPNDAFLQEEAEQLMEPFEVLLEELRYLRHPFRSEYCPDCFPGGYGSSIEEGGGNSFLRGQGPKDKIRSRFGRLHFIRSRIEHDGEPFFPGGCLPVTPDRLSIPVKEDFS